MSLLLFIKQKSKQTMSSMTALSHACPSSTAATKIIIRTTWFVSLCRRIHAWRSPLAAASVTATISLSRMRVGHFTLAVVIDRTSLICRPENKYPSECCQPASLSDRVGYFISFPRSHISSYYMLDCFWKCCCAGSGFIGKNVKVWQLGGSSALSDH